MVKRVLSGWARLWIAIGAVIWGATTIVGVLDVRESSGYELAHTGGPMPAVLFWVLIIGWSVAGLVYGMIALLLAMIARAVTTGDWRALGLNAKDSR
jgi:hypothetical protein